MMITVFLFLFLFKLSSKSDYQYAVISPTYCKHHFPKPTKKKAQKTKIKTGIIELTTQSQDFMWYFLFTTKKVLHIYWIALYPPLWIRSSYQNKRKNLPNFPLRCLLFNKLPCGGSLYNIKEGYVFPLKQHLVNTIPLPCCPVLLTGIHHLLIYPPAPTRIYLFIYF